MISIVRPVNSNQGSSCSFYVKSGYHLSILFITYNGKLVCAGINTNGTVMGGQNLNLLTVTPESGRLKIVCNFESYYVSSWVLIGRNIY